MRDHEIIEMYWARNENAIAATAEKYGNYCHTIAYNILHNREDAEECSNDTYLVHGIRSRRSVRTACRSIWEKSHATSR